MAKIYSHCFPLLWLIYLTCFVIAHCVNIPQFIHPQTMDSKLGEERSEGRRGLMDRDKVKESVDWRVL